MNAIEPKHTDAVSDTNAALIKQDRVIKRMGGKHLIFRTKTGGWWMLPKPYVLVSTFRGPVWIFYGVGQVWVTHKKLREIDGWMARVPRFVSNKLIKILDHVEPKLKEFITYCNDSGIEGTIVMERKCLEFHWQCGVELDKERAKPDNSDALDRHFHELVDKFIEAKKDMSI